MLLNITFSNLTTPEVVRNVSSMKGPMDVYCWYEGPRGLPQKGAQFINIPIRNVMVNK